MNKYKPLVTLLLILIGFCAYAQEYPVNVTTVLTPPYSLYLSDYTSPETNSLQVIIQLRELDRPEYRVKLRITIEGQGITIRTKPSYNPPTLILQGGVPEMLSGADLSRYLSPDNLDFSGISRQEFLKKGTFPEGFYTFKVEVIDYIRNVVVSNPGFANAWIILNDPPLINLPFNDDKVIATDPQNIFFNWTPRHTASPNAAFSTEYEFTLVELYPVGRIPNDAIRVANPIFVTTTQSTSLNYGVMEPMLIPGRKYAFRVKAFDTGKRDLFKNNGFSEVFVFQYGDACIAPLNIKSEALDATRIKLTWEPTETHTGFTVKYKKQGGTTWYEEKTFSNSIILPELQGNTTYEYQVSGTCGTIQGLYSSVATITTPEKVKEEFACGAPPPQLDIKTTPLLNDLQIKDRIKTSDFEVSISTVERNSDGTYKGTGRALLPWLKFASVEVKFHNIRVNEEYRVYDGNVTTIYSVNSSFVANIDLTDDKLKGENADGTNNPNAPSADDFKGIDTTYAGDIKNITVDIATGNILIANEDGTTTVMPREKDEKTNTYDDVRVTDSNGDKWRIDSNGTVTQEPSTTPPNAIASADAIDFTVQFAPNTDQNYGFDQKAQNSIGTYNNIKVKGADYWISWKSVETGRQDFVSVQASGKETFPAIVGFKTSIGEAPSQPGATINQKQLIVLGQGNADESISAYVLVKEPGKEQTQVEVGRLNVRAYDKVRKHLIIVPVNDVAAPDGTALTAAINSIYKSAVAEWDITVEAKFTIDNAKLTGLDAGESGLLASFPEKSRDFNRAFKNDRNIDNDAYYIFLIKGSGSSLSGFMPFKRKFGYIFTDNLGNLSLETTIAHEIGHGAFRLRHTFSTEAFMAAERSTDNLMDYKGGTALRKHQWDFVHDPESMNGWMQDDDESASEGGILYKCLPSNLTKIAAQEYYHNLNGKSILLNSKYEPYAFVGAGDTDHTEGSLAMIKRIGDGKLFYPTEKHEYYSLKQDRRVDEKFVDFVEDNKQTPTVVLINADCSYTIKRGTAETTGKIAACDCFDNTNSSSNGPGSESKVINKTGEEIDLTSIKDLLSGKKIIQDSKLGEIQKSVAYLYLTSDANKDGIGEVEKAVVPEGIIKLWLHKDLSGNWTIKEGGNTARINDIYHNTWKSGFTLDLNTAIQGKGLDLTSIATATYKIADWLSSKIGKLSIPESWWNCDNTEKNGITKDDPKYFNPPWFIEIVKYILSPTAYVVDQLIQMIPPGSEYAKLKEFPLSNLQLALMAGVWDGFVGLITALPDAIKMATMFTADDPTARRSKVAMEKLIADNGGGIIGTGKMVFNAIAGQFNIDKPCVFAHSVGQVGFDIIVAVFTAGTATTASRFASTIKTIITTLDKLDVLGNSIGSVVGASLKVAFKGTNKVLTITIRNGVKLIEATFENGKYVFKVIGTTADVLADIDWSVITVAQLKLLDGRTVNLPVLMDPSKKLKDAIYTIKKILKDNNGIDIRTEKGEVLAEFEISNTKTNLDGKTEVGAYKEGNAVPGKTKQEHDAAIASGSRSEGTLATALEEAGFPKAANVVKHAGDVHDNNLKLLDEKGDPKIPAAIADYSFTRSGKVYSKQPGESWKKFFDNLTKFAEVNGQKIRYFNPFESHHIFPVDLFKIETFRKWYELIGHQHYDINGEGNLDNLIMLEAKRNGNVGTDGVKAYEGGVHARHDAYTDRIGQYFQKRWEFHNKDGRTDAEIAELVDDDVMRFADNLKASLLQNSVKRTVEISTFWEVISFESLLK